MENSQAQDCQFGDGGNGMAATLRAVAGPQAAGPAAVEQTGGGVETNVPPDQRMVSLSAKAMPLRDALAQVCRQAKVELEFEEGSAEAPVCGRIRR